MISLQHIFDESNLMEPPKNRKIPTILQIINKQHASNEQHVFRDTNHQIDESDIKNSSTNDYNVNALYSIFR